MHAGHDTAFPMASEPGDILAFPRGAAAGECLHAIFERIDFTAPQGWPAVVDTTLQQHRLATPRGTGAAAAPAPMTFAPAVLRMLGEVMAAPLSGGLVLGQVAAADRVVELEFCLPARGVSLVAVDVLMRRGGLGGLEGQDGLAGLGPRAGVSAPLTGYLRGFIDLIVRDGERWHVIDWKSNHLGVNDTDYRGAALARAMAEHGYTLQALLYALALHRWLAARLQGYSPQRHLGGVHYLFVRGMRAAWPGAGVYSWQPQAGMLDAVSALFDGGGQP